MPFVRCLEIRFPEQRSSIDNGVRTYLEEGLDPGVSVLYIYYPCVVDIQHSKITGIP